MVTKVVKKATKQSLSEVLAPDYWEVVGSALPIGFDKSTIMELTQ